MVERLQRSEEEWRAILTPEQYRVCRQRGTERPFAGEYVNCKTPGIYTCVCCGQPLFHSRDKFDSGTGWPSFTRPLSQEGVATREDDRLGMRRIEVLCARCDAHLGHLFEDGPPPTGLRYCINSVALALRSEESGDATTTTR